MGGWKRKCPSVMQKSAVRGTQRMGVTVGVSGRGATVNSNTIVGVDVAVCIRIG